MYISIGKYTVNGQNVIDPIRARNALKNGNIIATNVASITYADLQINRKRLILKQPMMYSLLTNLLSGHLLRLKFSTNAKNGWITTYKMSQV